MRCVLALSRCSGREFALLSTASASGAISGQCACVVRLKHSDGVCLCGEGHAVLEMKKSDMESKTLLYLKPFRCGTIPLTNNLSH